VNDYQQDRLVRQAQASAAEVALDLSRGGQELLEEIMSTSLAPLPLDPGELEPVQLPARPAPERRKRRALIGLAAAAAFAVAIGGPTIAFHGRSTIAPAAGGPQSPIAASGNPRLLLDDPAWTIAHVQQFTADTGEMTFTAGTRRLEVHWTAAALYPALLKDRVTGRKPVPVQAFARTGALITYSNEDFAALLPPQGKNFLEVRGEGADKAAFLAVLAELKQVPLPDWNAAMPVSVLTPAQAPAAITQMLADVPLPAGFDRSSLKVSGTNDYYQVGAQVIGAVTCAWLDRYENARKAQDAAGTARVVKALRNSRQWAVLQQMSTTGDYPEVLWSLTGKVAQGQDVGGYRRALGCA
jgi:hypothetical protein